MIPNFLVTVVLRQLHLLDLMATFPIEVHHMVDHMLFGEDPTFLFPLDRHFDRKHIMANSCEAKSKILNASD